MKEKLMIEVNVATERGLEHLAELIEKLCEVHHIRCEGITRVTDYNIQPPAGHIATA